jgi:hypothetical protein
LRVRETGVSAPAKRSKSAAGSDLAPVQRLP